MSEVWVPTEHARTSFLAAGVDPAKLHVVPEPVDAADEFNPAAHRPMRLPLGAHVFGPAWPHEAPAAAGSGTSASSGSGITAKPYVFLSVFKWEARKVGGGCSWPDQSWQDPIFTAASSASALRFAPPCCPS